MDQSKHHSPTVFVVMTMLVCAPPWGACSAAGLRSEAYASAQALPIPATWPVTGYCCRCNDAGDDGSQPQAISVERRVNLPVIFLTISIPAAVDDAYGAADFLKAV
jgi:hypothetical protein